MRLKPAILSVLGRDDLKHIVDDLEIDGVDRRSVEGMRAALSRARRASAADLLWYMQKGQIQEVCEIVGVSAKGKRDELVERLLNGHGDLTVASSKEKDRPKQRMANNHSDTERRLWDAADEFRANSDLKSSEYATPVLGLIFLRYSDHRFTLAEKELEGKGSGRRKVGREDYQAKGVMFLPPSARFSHLL